MFEARAVMVRQAKHTILVVMTIALVVNNDQPCVAPLSVPDHGTGTRDA
jgi:hypothetical protein